MDKKTSQQLALEAALDFLDGKIGFEQFITNYPDDTDDKDVDELFDLIEHQPKLGGFLGVSQKNYDHYNQRIKDALERLEVKLKNSNSTTKPIS